MLTEKRVRRIFSPEQKVSLIQQVDSAKNIKRGCEEAKINFTQYRTWKKQYELGIKSSLRNSKPAMDPEAKRLREENRILKLTVINLSIEITDLKKR